MVNLPPIGLPGFRPPGYSEEPFEQETAAVLAQGATRGARNALPVLPSLLVHQREIDHILASILKGLNVNVVGSGGMGSSTAAVEAARRAVSRNKSLIYLDLARIARPDEAVRKVALALGVPLQTLRLAKEPLKLIKTYRAQDDIVLLDNCQDPNLVADVLANLASWILVSRVPSKERSQVRATVVSTSALAHSESELLLSYAFPDQDLPRHHLRTIVDEFGWWPLGIRFATGVVRLGGGVDAAPVLALASKRGDRLSVLANAIWESVPQDVARILSALVTVNWLQVNNSNIAVLAELSSGTARSSLEHLQTLGVLQRVSGAYRLQNSLRIALKEAESAPRQWEAQNLYAALRLVRSRVRRIERQLRNLQDSDVGLFESPYFTIRPRSRRSSTFLSDIEWLEREWSSIEQLLDVLSGVKPLKEVSEVIGSLRECLGPLGRLDSLQRLEEFEYRATRAYGGLTEQREALYRLAEALEREGRLLDAIGARQQALALSRNAGDPQQIGADLLYLARLRSDIGQPVEAVTALEEAVALFRSAHWVDGEARALVTLGELYEVAKKTDDAAAAYNRALRLLADPTQGRDRATVLIKLGLINQGRGRLKEARQAYTAAAAAIEGRDEPALIALSKERLGKVLALEGLREEAVSALQEALVGYRESRDRQGELNALLALAEVENSQGDRILAKTYYFNALNLAEALDDSLNIGNALLGVGEIFVKETNLPEASQYLERAIATFHASRLQKYEANTLQRLAAIRGRSNERRTAISALRKAYDLYLAIVDESGLMTSSRELGAYFYQLHDYREAAAHFEESATRARNLSDKGAEAVALQGLKQSYVGLSLSDEAGAIDQRLQYLTRALGLSERESKSD